MQSADQIIDIGPGAGEHGGEIVFSGSPKQILQAEYSITGQYLSGEKAISVPDIRRKGNGKLLKISGACGNNLKKVEISFPLGKMIVVTGVSGSGKSTLVNETIFPVLSKELNNARAYPLPYESIIGLDYYKLLSQSSITFNKHADKSYGSVGNMRMFEATGVGTCLLTDTGENMKDLFEADKEVVLEAVKQTGIAFQYADDSLKKDKETVLEAVKLDGYTLDYADDM